MSFTFSWKVAGRKNCLHVCVYIYNIYVHVHECIYLCMYVKIYAVSILPANCFSLCIFATFYHHWIPPLTFFGRWGLRKTCLW